MTVTDFAMYTPEGNAAVAAIMAALPVPATKAEVHDDLTVIVNTVCMDHPEVRDTVAVRMIFAELMRKMIALA